MKLEQFENSLLFSTTSIPDAFFTEYYSQASSDAIKVFLYLYFYSKFYLSTLNNIEILWYFGRVV